MSSPISFNTRETYFRGPLEKATKSKLYRESEVMERKDSMHLGSGPPRSEKSKFDAQYSSQSKGLKVTPSGSLPSFSAAVRPCDFKYPNKYNE